MLNNPIDELDFTDKVVSFGTVGDTLALKNIKFQMQNGKLFVTGNIPKGATTNDWAINRPCAIEWNSVTDYIVFDNEQQYAELIEKSN